MKLLVVRLKEEPKINDREFGIRLSPAALAEIGGTRDATFVYAQFTLNL